LYKLRVKEVAQEMGYNMAQLSRKTGVDFKTIKTIFRNPYHNVEFHVLTRIAEGLNVPLTDLVEQEPD
jgi:transcriptional regulator with XRE-family HTH domain